MLGNAARNPPARAGQVANQLNPRNPRPNPRSPTPSDIDGEVELATIDEDGDAPALVNVPGMPVDPGMAIVGCTFIHVILCAYMVCSCTTARPRLRPLPL